jgi:hypothetical protein
MSDLDHCRAKNVARRRELGSDAGAGRESFAEFDGSQEPERVPLEQMPIIQEQDLTEVSGRRRAIDLSLESILHQQWQVAGMIEVRMGEDDAAHAPGRESIIEE